MSGRATLNRSNASFIALAEALHSQSHLHADDWRLDAAQLATFDALLDVAKTAYDANSNRSTKNAVSTANKNAAFGDLRAFLSLYINTLVGNSRVPDEALNYMGLRSRHSRRYAPLPRPTDPIVLSVKRRHDEMTVHASRPEHGHPTDGVGVKKHYGFMLRYRIEGAEREEILISTRLRHTLFFDRADEGKKITLAAAWVNPRLETGPWSEDINEIIG
ncbi:MAG: hypothetical protein LBF90_06330 [Prevotellaceae bacterium]|jgi:hypothetical protein|nr:hypothetical protein [Prevotellaceae bacterium]